MTLLNKMCVGVFCLLSMASTSSWAQIIHWEIDAKLLDPSTVGSQERVFSGGFDYDTVTNSIFNVSIFSTGTTGSNCFLCFDYTGATAGFFVNEVGSESIFFEKRVDYPPAYRENTLNLVGLDITQPGVIEAWMSEEYYYMAGTGNPVDDTWVSDMCSGSTTCATLTGTLVPIPEPETYAMLMAGLGLLGFKARRKSLRIA